MRFLLKIKPFIFLLGFVGLLPILILIFKIWATFVTDIIKPYGISIFMIGFMSCYFLWIYLLGYGFNELDKKTGKNLKIIKLGLIIIITFFSMLFFQLTNFYIFINHSNQTLYYLNVLFSLIPMFFFIQITIKLTKYFRLYDGKDEPRIIDYIITMMLLCCFPFGLIIMHAHLRLFLKEKLIIK